MYAGGHKRFKTAVAGVCTECRTRFTAAKPETAIQADIGGGSLTNNWTYIREEKGKDGNFQWVGTEANTFSDGQK